MQAQEAHSRFVSRFGTLSMSLPTSQPKSLHASIKSLSLSEIESPSIYSHEDFVKRATFGRPKIHCMRVN